MVAQTVAGPLSGGFGQYIGWRGVFLLLAAIALVLAIVLRLQLAGVVDRLGTGTFTRANYAALAREPAARFLLLATLVEGSFVAAIVPFIAPYLNEVFQLSYASAGLVLACFGLGALAFGRIAPLSGALPRRVGHGADRSVPDVGGRPHRRRRAVVGVADPSRVRARPWLLHAAHRAPGARDRIAARGTLDGRLELRLHAVHRQSLGALASGAAIGWGGYPVAFAVDGSLLALLGLVLWASFRRRSA